MPNKMIMDKSEKSAASGESHAWTKLLGAEQEQPGKQPVIVKMSNNYNNNNNNNMEKELAVDCKEASPLDVAAIAAVDAVASVEPPLGGYNRSATYGSGINSAGGESSGSGTLLTRKESFLGTFHRQLRRSIKAVSESPGPLTR